MGAILKRLWGDEVYATQIVRSLMLAVAFALSSGAIDLGKLNEHLGALGWWLSPLIAGLAAFMRAGDKTTPGAAAIEHAPHDLMASGLVQLGVPSAVAEAAAAKSDTQTAPKV